MNLSIGKPLLQSNPPEAGLCHATAQWSCLTGFILLLSTSANAGNEPSIPFVDGLWSGDVETAAGTSDFRECRARTVSVDGTTLTLAKRVDGSWQLRLSNPGWQLPPSHRYDMTALVDYYPQQVLTAADVTGRTSLEIANLDRISLLELIENGHTIELTADGFYKKYDLEGSAKIIQRIRNCFAEHG